MSPPKPVPDVSVVVTAHHEGSLLHRTMRSVRRAVRYAETYGFAAEMLLVLDRADAATRRYVAAHLADVRVIEVDLGDVGPARNEGARRASGRFVCFLDGDDLFSAQWLARACRTAEAAPGLSVYLPEYVVIFGARDAVLCSQGSTLPGHNILTNLEINFRISAFFAPLEQVLARPFQPCPRGEGFGYEDWHWWCEVLAADVPIHTVPGTCLFVRIKSSRSRFLEDAEARALLRPSRLFDGAVLRLRFEQELRRTKDDSTVEQALARLLASLAPPVRAPSVLASPAPPASFGKRFTAVARLLARTAANLLVPRLLMDWQWQLRQWWKESRRPLEPTAVPNVREPSPPALPDWLFDEWRAAHDLEPLLFPTRETVGRAEVVRPEQAPQHLGAAYLDLWRRLPDEFTHVVLTSRLQAGATGRAAVNYVRALVEGGLSRGVLVLATEDADSPWAQRLPAGATFLPFGGLYRHFGPERKRLLLARLFLQRPPQVLHNIHSSVGCDLLLSHGTALCQTMRLYCHASCDDLWPTDGQAGAIRRCLPGCIDALTAVLGDNQTELDGLAEQFAFDRDRLVVHYQPVEAPPGLVSPRPGMRSGLEVLWAGRLDQQKMPDLLAAIASRCLGYPFRFHVYDSALHGLGRHAVPRGPNVVYHGRFDGFESLPVERFDAFLYTGQGDGLPDILLDAMAAGLPVVASAIGGVPELVVHGQTGLLAEPFDDPESHVRGLLALFRGEKRASTLINGARALLGSRHSWAAFCDAVRATNGYGIKEPERAAA